MSNELTTASAAFPVSPAINQTGEKNINVTNENGGIVNFNFNLPAGSVHGNAEQMIAVQSFSKAYYQLLVTCGDDFMTSNVVTVIANRALTQHLVPHEIFERCSALSEAGIEELKTFPAIICRENTDYHGITDPQFAVYGYITRVKNEGREIKVAFHPLGVIQQQVLCEKKNAVYFDLNMECAITDLNISAWSVHKVNLFEAFDEAGLTNLPRPL